MTGMLSQAQKNVLMQLIQERQGDSQDWPPQRSIVKVGADGSVGADPASSTDPTGNTGAPGAQPVGKGMGKGKGGTAAPKARPKPKPSKDDGLFVQFEVELKKAKRDRRVERGYNWCLVDSTLGLGCQSGHEIAVIMVSSPLGRHNSAQTPENRVRIGDFLVAVDGVNLAEQEAADWRQLVSKGDEVCVLTIRRPREMRKAITLMRQEGHIVGMLMSGAEAFSLSEEAAATTVGVLREAVAGALRAAADTVTIYDGGR